MIDIGVTFAGVSFKNPVVAASGTFGFGREYAEFYDLSQLGGICIKGLTRNSRPGNPPPRIAESPMGMLNSVGLQNPGAAAFIRDDLPFLRGFDTVIIANISGDTIYDYAEIAKELSDAGVDMIEVNVSCPNVKEGGILFGTSAKAIAEVTEAVKKNTAVPVIVKLSPNVTDITEMAKAAERSGADAISLINTIIAMRIDIKSRRPVLYNNTGGLSGPAVFPVAVRMVWQTAKAVNIPVLGMGGISSGEDAVEMMLAGANLVGVGTASIADPYAPLVIVKGIEDYLLREGVGTARELTGKVVIN